MNINDALNKICVYSSILGCGKDTDKGSLLECFGVSLYNNVNEHTDDTGRYLELDVKFVKNLSVIIRLVICFLRVIVLYFMA